MVLFDTFLVVGLSRIWKCERAAIGTVKVILFSLLMLVSIGMLFFILIVQDLAQSL